MNMKRRTLSWLLSIVALIVAVAAGLVLLWTAPQTEPEEKVRAVRMVRTMPLKPRSEPIFVEQRGEVIPARRVVMQSEVAGRVIRHHPSLVPGGYVQAGEELIKIDPSEYLLALTEMESALEEARYEQEVEQGRQVVASRELKLLEEDLSQSDVNRALVLREPHLRRTEALIQRATNEIAKARLDLARTSVQAPFNAMVLDENIELGQQVSPSSTLCTLVGTDEFWVQALLPHGDLKWIQLPGPNQPGSEVTVLLHTGDGDTAQWKGRVIRLLSDLDPVGRMARVMIRVTDPLDLEGQRDGIPLLLGSYVEVRIDAGMLEDVIAIPRAGLREGNRIWVVDQNHAVRIREADIKWSRRDTVLIANNVKPGEELILFGLRNALPGLQVEPRPMDDGAVADVAEGLETGLTEEEEKVEADESMQPSS